MNVRVTVKGMQGHVAYPAKALNPIPALAALATRLTEHKLDDGTAHFEPSTLSFTGIDTGNAATNVIPAEARAALNIRFNELHTPETLMAFIEGEAKTVSRQTGCEIALEQNVSGTAFLTKPGPFVEFVAKAVESVTGRLPEFSTGGGTSDARFIAEYCPVAELGLPNATMHQTDESAAIADIQLLTDIYVALLVAYFKNPPQ
jgi:succinyl-diaminopimelate desuccinylase